PTPPPASRRGAGELGLPGLFFQQLGSPTPETRASGARPPLPLAPTHHKPRRFAAVLLRAGTIVLRRRVVWRPSTVPPGWRRGARAVRASNRAQGNEEARPDGAGPAIPGV